MKTDNDGFTKYTFIDKAKDWFNNHEGWLLLGFAVMILAIVWVATR